MFEHFLYFLILYNLPEAREASRNLPGARGSIFPKYEPEISILDPIQLIYVFWCFSKNLIFEHICLEG